MTEAEVALGDHRTCLCPRCPSSGFSTASFPPRPKGTILSLTLMGCAQEDWICGKFLNIIFGITNLQHNIKMAGASLVESFEGELGMGPGQESHMF